MNTTQVRRRASLRAVCGLLAVSVVASVLLLADPASATTTTPLSPSAWAQFLADHPELKVRTALGVGGEVAVTEAGAGALAAGGAEVAVGGAGALEAGAFYLGYTVGHDVLGPALFHWAFGSNGDARVLTMSPYFTLPGWSWAGGTCCNSPALPVPPVSFQGTDVSRSNLLWNQTGVTRTVVGEAQCVSGVTGENTGSPQLIGPVSLSWTYSWVGLQCSSGQVIGHVNLFDATSGLQLYGWTYDVVPNAPWTVHTEVQCRRPDGTTFQAISANVTVTPGSGLVAPPISVPSCPAILPGATPEVITVRGGRATDSPTQLLAAMPAPSADPTATTTTTTDPQPSGSPVPGVGSSTGTNPADDPAGDPSAPSGSGRNCMGSFWSWNPVNWVFVPVKCALQWAFVPDPVAVQSEFGDLSDAWGATPMAVWAGGFTSIVAPLGGFVGAAAGPCAGPSFHFHFIDWVFEPFSACEGLPQRASELVLPVESFFVYGAGFFLCLRMLTRTIGLSTPEDT